MVEVDLQSMVTRLPAVVYSYAINHETGESSFPYVSPYCEQMFGFPASDIMNDPKAFVNCIVEEEVANFSSQVMESMTNLTPFDRLGKMRHKDGRILHIHGKSMPRVVESLEDNGTITRLTVWDGVLFDVTKQVCNEKATRTRLEQMMDTTLQPIFQINTKGCILQWNNAMTKATEYTQEQVMGQPVIGFMAEEERVGFAAFCSHAVRSSQSSLESELQNKDFVFLSRDGQKKIFLRAKCTFTRDDNGCPNGLLCCCQDVTSVKEAQQQKDAALKLVDAERGLTEWLSHEVRNPLSVAMEAAVALQESGKPQSDENASYSDLICESIHYIVDLLTNILDLNKCLDGKITLHPMTCHIKEEVLEPTCKIMGVSRNNRVQLELGHCDDVVASVDKLRLRQVVTNLIANSLKYTEEGFVRVELKEMVDSSQQHETLRIYVSDSGCGIDPSNHKVLFSKWERLGSQINGSGIGLCLSKSLANAMGGDLTVNRDYKSGYKNKPGAQFVVEIPLSTLLSTEGHAARAPAFETVSAAVRGAKRKNSRTRAESFASYDSASSESKKRQSLDKKEICLLGKYHILIVDDDDMGRRMLKRRLSRLFPEADITEVESGEAALVETSQKSFDLITMDHFMAVDDMDGAETIRALRARDEDCCIVGISGNSKRAEHLAAGAQDFFQKPIPKDEVLMERLISKMAPPSGWKVLCVDDVELNNRFLCQRLCRVSAPYFTSMEQAQKRWNITSRSTGREAIELLETEWFDLVVLDNHLEDGITGMTVARYMREHGMNSNALVVLNSGTDLQQSTESGFVPSYNLYWTKPLPKTEQMRMDLCRELLTSKTKQGRVASIQTRGAYAA